MPSWRKVIVSGSDASLNSLNAPSITGSLQGSSSFAVSASRATSASFLTSNTNAFIQGGNSFGAFGTLGTNDGQPLIFITSGSNRMYVSTVGDVGIGTGPLGAKFHVSGNANLVNWEGQSHAYQSFYPQGYGNGRFAYIGYAVSSSNDFTITSEHGTGNMLLGTSGSTRLFISSSGSVGIGTTNPSLGLLQVAGNIYANSITGSGLLITGSSTSDLSRIIQAGSGSALNITHQNGTSATSIAQLYGGTTPRFNFRSDGLFSWGQNATGSSYGFLSWDTGKQTIGAVGVNNLSLFTNGSERMTISSSGLIGIGITTPSASLHITNTTTTNSFLVEDSTNPDNTPFLIDNIGNTMIGTTSSLGPLTVRGDGATGVTMDTDAATNQENQSTRLFFKVSGSNRDISIRNFSGSFVLGTRGTSGTSSGTSVMVISASGDTGIGSGFVPSAARVATLQVSGNISIETGDAYKQDGQNVIYIAKGTDSYYASIIAGATAGTSGSARQTAYGYNAGASISGSFQTAIGYAAGYSNRGSDQTAVGYNAGRSNSGSFQTALGSAAGYENTGNTQTAVGGYAGVRNVTNAQTAIGYYAGYENSGSNQTAVGYYAGWENSGSAQTVIGVQAGYLNTGSNQTALGYNAGYQNYGSLQTAVGTLAGYLNRGSDQTAVGYEAGYYNSGSNQTAIGVDAGYLNSGSFQTVVGGLAGSRNSAEQQTAVGYNSGRSNLGSLQTAIGSNAGYVNVGANQTAIGASAGYYNSGSSQTTIGVSSGQYNSGSNQTVVGVSAGQYNSGSNQTAIGHSAGRNNASRDQTAVGYVAGQYNSGSSQTAIGYGAGTFNSASNQTTVGYGSGQTNEGEYQTAIGVQSGQNNIGDAQTAVGYFAGARNSGSNQTAVGYSAGYLNSGSDNTNIGYNAGYLISAGLVNSQSVQSVFLGSTTYAGGANRTNQIVIGYNASGIGSNSVVLGNNSILTTALKGFVGIGTTSPTASLHITNTSTSASFLVEDNTNPDSTPFVIDATGNVGIGTINPTAKLEVVGSYRFGPTTNGSVYFQSWDYGTDMDISSVSIGGWARAHRITTSDSGGAVYFGVYGNTTTTERAYWTIGTTGSVNSGYNYTTGVHLLKNGNVGIGTLTPTAKLDVNGNLLLTSSVTTTININSAAVRTYIASEGAGTSFGALSNHPVNFYQSGSIKMFIDNNGGNTVISGSLSIGTSSAGPTENTLTLGARDNVQEGGQLGFNAPGGTYTSASFIDLYQNRLRILKGTNATSTGEVANWNMHSLQMALPAYSSVSSFPGTAVGYLAFDAGGNVITTAGVGGSPFPFSGSAVITGSLLVTGSLTVTGGITGSMQGTSSYADTASISNATLLTQLLVINQTGFTINKGAVVRISSSNNASDIPRITTASYEDDSVSANTLGIASAAITNGSQGYITTEGVLTGISTTGWTSGTLLFLGAAGSITATVPQAPLHAVRLGQVIREQNVNGSISIRVDNGYELNELHDITDNTTTTSYGDLLIKSGSVWKNSTQLTGSYALTGSLTVTGSLSVNNTLFTSTTATANIGSTTIYSVSTSSYDAAWFEYVARSGSNARAGQIMSIESGSAVNFTETTTTDFGSTSGLSLGVYIVNGAMALTASAATNGWSIKTIVRSI